jgi:hypothetical protein
MILLGEKKNMHLDSHDFGFVSFNVDRDRDRLFI